MVGLSLVVIALFGYLCGSIATSVWIGKLFYKKDVREFGSGNAGATNVFRVLGWKPALIVVIVDVVKGAVPTYLAPSLWMSDYRFDSIGLQLIGGIAAVMGHVWTVFAGFRGGKGVATLAGMLIVLYPTVIPICLAVFVLVVALTRYVSLASMCAALTLPIGLLILRSDIPAPLLFLSFLIALFILFTHRSNIRRLLAGTENRIGR